jgi:hypothetical protein
MSPVPVLIPSAIHCCNPTRIHHHHYEAQITSTPSPSSPHLHQPGAASLIPARIAKHRRALLFPSPTHTKAQAQPSAASPSITE